MARQIKQFKLLYCSFFSLTFDSLPAILVLNYKNSIKVKLFRFYSIILLLSQMGFLCIWYMKRSTLYFILNHGKHTVDGDDSDNDGNDDTSSVGDDNNNDDGHYRWSF
jgi:hypothetical protein